MDYDVTERENNCINKTNANEIAEFALTNYDEVERFIIHCEYGQSRSAGVAAALSDFFERHDNGISADSRYYPNWTCYKYVMKALRKRLKRSE